MKSRRRSDLYVIQIAASNQGWTNTIRSGDSQPVTAWQIK